MTRWFHTPLDLHRLWIESRSKSHYYIQGHYKLLSEIGRGASSIVHLVIDIYTNKRYAMKELSKSRLQKQYQIELLRQGSSMMKIKQTMIQEIEILEHIPYHKNILQFIQAIEDPHYPDSIFIVTEYIEKGMMMDIVPFSISTPFTKDQCYDLFHQLVDAIDHLHQHGIVHGDIKPQNLIVSNDHVLKLIDFGNATCLSDTQNHINPSIGSPAFIAPELLRKGGKHASYSFTCADIWSMGITLYCFVYGHLPFEKPNLLDLYHDIQHQPVTHMNTTNPILVDFMDQLLKKDPHDRITMEEIKAHPWFKKKQ